MQYDVLIRNGTIYDGTGSRPYTADLGISKDTISYLGSGKGMAGKVEIDASGLAVAPGFINILSWATESLIHDGSSQSDIRQGVTLEVFGEGSSMGPLNEAMKAKTLEDLEGALEEIPWTTLGEYLEFLERRGVSTNVASFVGATTVRIHELGYENQSPTEEELERMRAHVRTAMEEGAVGVGSALIYAPAFYASTGELIALCQVAAEFNGLYISHLRSESNNLLEALEELIRIAKETNIATEVYHFKAGGEKNHYKIDQAIERINAARSQGLKISTDMYTYTAGATGLDAAMPPWVQEGGYDAWAERLRDPGIRARVIAAMQTDATDWENLLFLAGSDGVILNDFKTEALRHLTGKTLQEAAQIRGQTPEETAVDLVIEDGSRVGAVYFLMSEENVRKQIQLPYMSFCSDAGSIAPEGRFLEYNPHPRAYGNFARLLGKYVRDEGLIPLEEAIRKLTSLTAEKLHLRRRGRLQPGYFADVVLFNPTTIQDHATFAKPHQYSTGVEHVFVNGIQVIKAGAHTGAKPGRVVRGPGWTGWE